MYSIYKELGLPKFCAKNTCCKCGLGRAAEEQFKYSVLRHGKADLSSPPEAQAEADVALRGWATRAGEADAAASGLGHVGGGATGRRMGVSC